MLSAGSAADTISDVSSLWCVNHPDDLKLDPLR